MKTTAADEALAPATTVSRAARARSAAVCTRAAGLCGSHASLSASQLGVHEASTPLMSRAVSAQRSVGPPNRRPWQET